MENGKWKMTNDQDPSPVRAIGISHFAIVWNVTSTNDKWKMANGK